MLKLNDQRGYRKFVNGRDEALETLLRNSRLRISESTSEAFRKVLEAIQIKYNHIMQTSSRQALDQLEAQIGQLLEHLSFIIWIEVLELRKKAFMLAYAGEAQAIAQTTAKNVKVSIPKQDLDLKSMGKSLSNGLAPMKSFNLHFNKLRRQIISSLEYSFAFGEPVEKALGRVFLCFPRQTILPKKKVLKTVKVAEAKKPEFSAFKKEDDSVEISLSGRSPISGFEWDQETWDKAIQDLASDHVYTDRSPEKFVDIKNPYNDLPMRSKFPEDDKIYHWEIENEVVQDFVEQVRSGQIEAAKKNGINDFVWIAILDDRTDACCEWRSGLLTSEIEARLKTDKRDDPCQAIVPPAHFNCRCTLAPASQDLEAVDNTDSEREFDEWLNQR